MGRAPSLSGPGGGTCRELITGPFWASHATSRYMTIAIAFTCGCRRGAGGSSAVLVGLATAGLPPLWPVDTAVTCPGGLRKPRFRNFPAISASHRESRNNYCPSPGSAGRPGRAAGSSNPRQSRSAQPSLHLRRNDLAMNYQGPAPNQPGNRTNNESGEFANLANTPGLA